MVFLRALLLLISVVGLLSVSGFESTSDVFRSKEPLGPQTDVPFGVEVKGPASQYLHRQALAYLHEESDILPGVAAGDEFPKVPSDSLHTVLPPTKPVHEHATVLQVSVYTFLMAAASVSLRTPFPMWIGLSFSPFTKNAMFDVLMFDVLSLQ